MRINGTIKTLAWAGSTLCVALGVLASLFAHFELLPKLEKVRANLVLAEDSEPGALDSMIQYASWGLWVTAGLGVLWLITMIPVSLSGGRGLVGPITFLVLICIGVLVVPLVQLALVAITTLIMAPLL